MSPNPLVSNYLIFLIFTYIIKIELKIIFVNKEIKFQ